MRAISSLEVFLCSKAKICDLCCEVNCLYISNTKLVNLRETSVSLFILYCQYVLLLSALGGGLGRPRRLGIPSPEGERRMTNAHLKVLHFDLESSVSNTCRYLLWKVSAIECIGIYNAIGGGGVFKNNMF